MAMDVYIADIEGARAKGTQLMQNGESIAKAAAQLQRRIEMAFAEVDDEALRIFRAESLQPYCAALAEVGATCRALGDAAIKIIDGSVRADQEAAAMIRGGTAYA